MREFTCVSLRRRPWAVVALVLVLLLAACQPRPAQVATAPDAAPPAAATGEPSAAAVPGQSTQAPATVEPATVEPATPTQAAPTDTPTLTPTPLPTDTPTPAASPTPSPTIAPRSLTETENILVLGMDQRPGERGWRTDTIIVVAIDHEAKQVGLISIPRDLWVDIPGYGPGRINQVDVQGEVQKYPGGGPALAQKVIQDTLGIPTQRWVRLRLEALPELVDALGGVTVTLDCPLHELTPDPKAPDSGRYEHFDLPAGEVFMNGATAAKFARYRYASNDFSRASRQQQLIWAIKERALEINVIPRIPELWNALSKTFQTDLTVLDLIRLARFGAGLQSDQIHGVVFSRAAMADAQVGPAWVVKIVSPAQVQKEIAGLFQATPIAAQGRGGTGVCPTPAPKPTETATPAADAASTVTPTP